MGAGSVTAAQAPAQARRRSWRWVLIALVAIGAVAAIGTYLTAPRPGGRMDPASTQPEGAHALVALLRDQGVSVVVADSVADVEKAAHPGTLLLFAQTQRVTSEALLKRLRPILRAICYWWNRRRTPAPCSPRVSAEPAPGA